MTVRFLGTGPSRPIVERTGKSRRLQTATLFSHDGFHFLIDAGPSIGMQLRRFRVPRIHAVALTHRHADAAGGLSLLDQWAFSPTAVFVGPRERRRYEPRRFRHLLLTSWEPRVPFVRAPFTVEAFRVRHAASDRRFPTHGFHLRCGRTSITYASDVRDLPPPARRFFRGTDLLIVDGAGWTRDLPNHRGILNHVWEYVHAGNRRIIFTQIGRAVPPHEVASRVLRRHTSRAALAYDGMRVALP